MRSAHFKTVIKIGTYVLVLLSIAFSSHARERPTVVSSIRPLALLVGDIAGDHVQIEVLLDNNRSPHDFSLSIAQAMRLHDADLLLWVGPQFEYFLQGLPLASEQIVMAEVIGQQSLPQDLPQDLPPHLRHRHAQTHSRSDDRSNMHLWLSAQYTLALSQHVLGALTQLLPAAAADFTQRQQIFQQRLLAQVRDANQQLAAYRQRPFAVYHNAYGLFTATHGLDQALPLTEVPHQQISAKHLNTIGANIAGAHCLLAEKSDRAQAARYARLFELPLVPIDLLALDAHLTSFSDYYAALTQTFLQCLAHSPSGN